MVSAGGGAGASPSAAGGGPPTGCPGVAHCPPLAGFADASCAALSGCNASACGAPHAGGAGGAANAPPNLGCDSEIEGAYAVGVGGGGGACGGSCANGTGAGGGSSDMRALRQAFGYDGQPVYPYTFTQSPFYRAGVAVTGPGLIVIVELGGNISYFSGTHSHDPYSKNFEKFDRGSR